MSISSQLAAFSSSILKHLEVGNKHGGGVEDLRLRFGVVVSIST